MDYHKEVDSAFNVLDFALQEYYADDPDIKGIYFDPLWIDVMKEAMVSTQRVKDVPTKDVIKSILQLFDLTTEKVNDCVFVHRHPHAITII